jgi:signal transduction histidine kinase/CheY-like chemotaxis protein
VLRSDERQQCELQLSGVRGVARRVRIESMRTHTGAWRVALIDITERYLLERQLAEARKLEAISTLASGVAHEFNNRLMAITGCADMALRQLADGKDARGPIEQLKQAAMRGRGVSAQLLTFASGTNEEEEVGELDAAVKSAALMLAQTLGDQIDLSLQLDALGAGVPLGSGLIEQVLLTLAANARDAMDRRGTLRISTQRHGDTNVLLSVTDDGCGMDGHVQARAFEPFFTTKGSGAGFGLGLSLVYGIVRRARGSVSLQSRVGVGTTVQIELPCVALESSDCETLNTRPTEAAMPDVARRMPELDGKVLVVEDEALIRVTIRQYLESWGYNVLEAEGLDQALDQLRSDSEIRLLISDVVLGHDALGSQVSDVALVLNPKLRVLYISAHPRRVLLQRGWIRRRDMVIEKPFAPEQLRRAVYATLPEADSAARHP